MHKEGTVPSNIVAGLADCLAAPCAEDECREREQECHPELRAEFLSRDGYNLTHV
jgi:hypothetical protein